MNDTTNTETHTLTILFTKALAMMEEAGIKPDSHGVSREDYCDDLISAVLVLAGEGALSAEIGRLAHTFRITFTDIGTARAFARRTLTLVKEPA